MSCIGLSSSLSASITSVRQACCHFCWHITVVYSHVSGNLTPSSQNFSCCHCHGHKDRAYSHTCYCTHISLQVASIHLIFYRGHFTASVSSILFIARPERHKTVHLTSFYLYATLKQLPFYVEISDKELDRSRVYQN